MMSGFRVLSAAIAVFCIPSGPVLGFDIRAPGPPPGAFAGPGAVYDYGPGFALLRPWYLDHEYHKRRYYRARDPYQYPMPVYIEPNYRFSGGYPHAYPLTGYLYPYPQTRYYAPPPPLPPDNGKPMDLAPPLK